ncbi:4'-phosphopantetheinyl transferase family protein [Massilia sp. TN1-12]|uniref:4'-phosphopantetheinyl transferase family protein n=1 Tax=Massilia paldalensis TaxID=3377675 RepID=UPI00384BF9A4
MAPPVRWWTVDGGFAPDTDWSAGQIAVVGVAGQAGREAARAAIRAALHAAIVQACGVAAQAVVLHAPPGSGEAPYALVGGTHRAAAAISHDGGLSLAAFRFDGRVGIDVMQVVPVPDWRAVARDYLGPVVAEALAALTDGERDAAFARAWSEHEARLKCLGWPLREWIDGDEAALQACTCVPLSVPAGYVATLAFG